MAAWLFSADFGQTERIVYWAVFNFLGGVVIHAGVRTLVHRVCDRYSRALLTGSPVAVGLVLLFPVVFVLLSAGGISVSQASSIVLLWTGIGIAAFLCGIVSQAVKARRS